MIAPTPPTMPVPIPPPMVPAVPHMMPNRRPIAVSPVIPFPTRAPLVIISEPLLQDSETSSRESLSPDSKALSRESPRITYVSAPQQPRTPSLPKVRFARKPRTPSPESPRIIHVQPSQTSSPPRTTVLATHSMPRIILPSRIAVDKPLRSNASKSEPRTVMQHSEVDDRGRPDRRPVPLFEEMIRNTDAYTRRRRSDDGSIESVYGSSPPVYMEKAGALTVVNPGDWPDTPHARSSRSSPPVYTVAAPTDVHQATPRRPTSLRHNSISTSRSNTIVCATTGAKDVRMAIPSGSSSIRHSSNLTLIAHGISAPSTPTESIFSFGSQTTISTCVWKMWGLRANPSPRSSIASRFSSVV
jgi:hypothetical protein